MRVVVAEDSTLFREGLVRLLASAGVRHTALSTDGDWLRPLAMFLKRTE